MKKATLGILAAVMFAGLFTSCKSDDDSNSFSSDDLVGAWAFDKDQEWVEGMSPEGELSYDDHEEGCTKDYIYFEATGDLTEYDFYNEECEYDTNVSSWTLSGKTLTITDSEIAAKVEKLDGSNLWITTTEEWEGLTYKYRIKLKKITLPSS